MASFVLLALACSFDGSGAGSAEGALGETAGETSAGDAGSASGSATASGSGGTSTSTSTGATTSPTSSTSASTTAGDVTGDPTGDPSTTGGDTGASEGVGETAGTGSESGGSQSAGSTGGGDGTAYPMCDAIGECEGDAMCTMWTLNNQPYGNICSPPCFDSNDCPPPPDSDAMPYCPPDYDFCLLVCETGNCPAGMSCEDTQFGPRCMWVL